MESVRGAESNRPACRADIVGASRAEEDILMAFAIKICMGHKIVGDNVLLFHGFRKLCFGHAVHSFSVPDSARLTGVRLAKRAKKLGCHLLVHCCVIAHDAFKHVALKSLGMNGAVACIRDFRML